MRVSYAELQEKVLPYGEIGKYLFEEMQEYGNSEKADWTMGVCFKIEFDENQRHKNEK